MTKPPFNPEHEFQTMLRKLRVPDVSVLETDRNHVIDLFVSAFTELRDMLKTNNPWMNNHQLNKSANDLLAELTLKDSDKFSKN